MKPIPTCVLIALSLLAASARAAGPAGGMTWVGAWGYPPLAAGANAPTHPAPQTAAATKAAPALQSPAAARPDLRGPLGPASVTDATLHQIVRVSVAGARIRLRFSNAFGAGPLVVGKATVAMLDEAGQAGPPHAITFDRRASATLAPGAPLISDPIELPILALQRLSIRTWLPQPTTLPGHLLAQTLSQGDDADAPVETAAPLLRLGAVVTGVSVAQASPHRVIVALGDSITEGQGSTPGHFKAWPDQLADRLAGRAAVVNSGVAGNRLLNPGTGESALARFDRDVLPVPGVSDLIVLEGINDINRQFNPRYGEPASAAELIAGYRQIVARAREHGLRVYLGTITPYAGASAFTPAGETIRQAVNAWIRRGEGFDGVIDFDAVARDSLRPDTLRPDYQSGDHLHPSDAGYAAMAEAAARGLAAGLARR